MVEMKQKKMACSPENPLGKSGVARHFAVKTKLLAAKLFNPFSQYGKSSVRCIVIAGGQCNNLISE